jgi:glycosyltransferase involved in cell wall biosynthesis
MSLLFVANFPSNTGYAWDTIETVYRRVGERIERQGGRVLFCYPSLAGGPPAPLSGSRLATVEFDYDATGRISGALRFCALLRRHAVTTLYLTDRSTWAWRYLLFRLAGVRCIVVHDRTSGSRTVRGRTTLRIKRAIHRLPWLAGDRFIGVSDFVVRRLLTANGTPEARTVRVYNGVEVERFDDADPTALHDLLALDPTARIVLCSSRAQTYKGVGVMIEAAARLHRDGLRSLVFVYCGDGPALDGFRAQAAAAGLEAFHFLGARGDVPRLFASATVGVVPSLWEEAFGLSVVEAMVAGVPVIATRSGGIPELVDDGRTGLLVEPGDADGLARAIRRVVEDPTSARRMARHARREARARFSIGTTVESLCAVLRGEPPLTGPRVASRRGGWRRPSRGKLRQA